MPSDKELRRHIADGLSTEAVARMYELNEDSVRSRVSRVDFSARVDIAASMATTQPLVNGAVAKQRELLKQHAGYFSMHQTLLQRRGGFAIGAFISDQHLPYTNWSAIELTLDILQYVNPDYISAFNDAFDFEGYGRWPVNRTPAAMLWSSDIWNAVRLCAEVYAAYRKAAPGAMLIQVQGNHDNWLYAFLRNAPFNGFSEHNVYEFMKAMSDMGVVQFVDGSNKQENIVTLSPGLKWVHGVSAAKNPAPLTLEQLSDDGVYYNVTSGHTHRAKETRMFGVTHWNSGMLADGDPKYLKFRPHWNTGIVINRYDPNSRYTEGTIIDFVKRGGNLVARYDGVDFDVRMR